MRTLTLILLLVFSNLAIAISADDISAHLALRLEKTPVLRAEFVQTKTLAAFKKPVQSRGSFVYSRSDGVLWNIEKPFKLSYVIQEQRISEVGEDGQVLSRTVQQNPAMAQIGQILRALLGAQLGPLREWFEVSAEGDDRRWTMTLTPKSSSVSQAIQRITLSGGQTVDGLTIQEPGGDQTQLDFRKTVERKAVLPEERRLFEAGRGAK